MYLAQLFQACVNGRLESSVLAAHHSHLRDSRGSGPANGADAVVPHRAGAILVRQQADGCNARHTPLKMWLAIRHMPTHTACK